MRALLLIAPLLLTAAACGGASKDQPVVTVPIGPAPTASAPAVVEAAATPPVSKPRDNLVEVSVLGVVQTAQGAAVLLGDSAQRVVVPIFIGGTEALSINLRFERHSYVRPLTHDLLDAVMHKLGGELVRVEVDDLKDNTFLGVIVVRRDGRSFEIDARPSDAIALALGNKAPIYVARSVIKQAGVPRDSFDLDTSSSGSMTPSSAGATPGP